MTVRLERDFVSDGEKKWFYSCRKRAKQPHLCGYLAAAERANNLLPAAEVLDSKTVHRYCSLPTFDDCEK